MQPPRLPILLGVAGVIPFLGATAALVAGMAAQPTAAVLALYALAIFAFLGGVHWGRALSTGRATDYVVSVLPSLVGVAAFGLTPPWTLAALSAAFAGLGAYDAVLYRREGPRWFMRLRLGLTVVVVLALVVASFVAPSAPPMLGLLGAA